MDKSDLVGVFGIFWVCFVCWLGFINWHAAIFLLLLVIATNTGASRR